MPRIDPERLLRCLQPLLDSSTGAIRSCEEVDKILGLMSKFSKKLVSKCIYINILKTTHPEVLDQFMQRGGWALIFGWTNDGVNTRNYPLLKEVLELLLLTPTTVPRLKENRFPLLVKGLSKDCEVLEIKNLAKQVVSKWITIAKAEEEACKTEGQQMQQQQPVQVPIVGTGILPTVPDLIPGGVPADLGQLAMNHSDPLVNIDPSLIPDAENQLMDLDLSHSDFANIDLNLDILSKVVDQQNLDENLGAPIPTSSTSNSITHTHHEVQQEQQHQLMLSDPSSVNTHMILTNTNNVMMNQPVTMPSAPIEQVQVQPQATEEVYRMIQVQPAPKIFIKTVGGQRTVVQSLASDTGSSYFMVIKDGKNVLMKLKEPSQAVTPIVIQQQATTTEAPSIVVTSKAQDACDSKEVHRSKPSKKDATAPTIKAKNSGETIKTYGSPKLKTSSEKDGLKKPVDQSAKHLHKSDKDKDKDKDKKKPSKDKASSSNEAQKKSKSSSQSSKTSQAALAAKQQAEEEKLREEIRKQKALVKKRAKEAEKQKQLEKDQETLKKLNLGPPNSSTSSSSLKIPKIPRRPTSFADAIGIPGADSSAVADKIKKIASDKEKVASKTKEDSPTPSSPTKKFYGRVEEPEGSESDKPKERRNKPKVFVSSKSRSDDLLKEMTESSKSKPGKEKEKEKEEAKPGVVTGNSIPATPKMTKRLSTDSAEKPGDTKKPKLSDSSSPSKTEKEKTKEKDSKDSVKDKEKKKPAPAISLKESTLFMDMLNASSETTKPSKRKRRTSTGNEKDKESSSPTEKSLKVSNSIDDEDSGTPVQDSTSTPDEPVKKPVFNFYRDTLNDSVEEENSQEDAKESSEKEESEAMDQTNESGSFTPQEGDGKIKSALCLVRPRNRPRKSVRWREDDELREYHFFEMDETERVNVTKQREFTELSQHERLNERFNMRRKSDEEESEAVRWRMPKIDFTVGIIQPNVVSQEKITQEAREATVLGLFLPPGATKPETPVEPDPADAEASADRGDPRIIPLEDVNVITKVIDFSTHSWPAPKSSMGTTPNYGTAPDVDDPIVNHVNNAFPAGNDYNPWNASLGFSVPPPTVVPNMGPMGDMAFSQFSIPPPGLPGVMNMNMLNPVQPPPAPVGFATPNPFAFPPAMVPPVNGPPPDSFGGNFNHDGRMGMSNRGGRYNDTDHRRNFHGRDRDTNNRDRGGSNSRDRDYRDDRGGRGDRDYRRRDRDNNDRDFRQYDRDRNSRDFRGNSRNVRKDIPCKFFKKGHCHLGSRCEFLHDGSSNHDDSRNHSNSRQDSFDSGRSRRSPDSSNVKDFDMRQSKSYDDEDWESEPAKSSAPPISENSTRFAQPPSSPTDFEIPPLTTSAESTKVIPV